MNIGKFRCPNIGKADPLFQDILQARMPSIVILYIYFSVNALLRRPGRARREGRRRPRKWLRRRLRRIMVAPPRGVGAKFYRSVSSLTVETRLHISAPGQRVGACHRQDRGHVRCLRTRKPHHFSGICASFTEKRRLFRAVFFQRTIGASPSGKAADFDSAMRRFETSRPSQGF